MLYFLGIQQLKDPCDEKNPLNMCIFFHVWAYQDHNLIALRHYFSSRDWVNIYENAAQGTIWDPSTLLDMWGICSLSITFSGLNYILGKSRSSSRQWHLESTRFSLHPAEHWAWSDTFSAGPAGFCACAPVSQPLTRSGQNVKSYRPLCFVCLWQVSRSTQRRGKKQWQLVKIIQFKHASYIRNN